MESNASSTSVRPGRGPVLVESSGCAIHTEKGGATAAVTDHGSKSMATVALVFGVSSTVLSMLLLLFCWGIWSRYDLLRIFYDDIKAELIRQGGNPHPHFPGESP